MEGCMHLEHCESIGRSLGALGKAKQEKWNIIVVVNLC